MNRIIGIGSAVYDILALTDKYPKEDTKKACQTMRSQGGGPCATALVAASKLGMDCEYWGNVGDDQAGQYIKNDFEKYHVNTKNLRIKKGYQSFSSFVLCCEETASRTCVYYKGTVPEPKSKDFVLEEMKGASFLHLDGYHVEFALEAAKEAKKLGILVSLDAGSVMENCKLLMPFVDILIASEEFALDFTKATTIENSIHILNQKYNPKVLVVTKGKEGGAFFDSNEVKKYLAFKVNAVDSNGAGDVFHGAMLFALNKGFNVNDSCLFASATSALKCTIFGARIGTPSYEEVIKFMRTKNIKLKNNL
ncbi:MAG: PfkB family carbohydrate kinase [Sphaerochaetaceae bacterium]